MVEFRESVKFFAKFDCFGKMNFLQGRTVYIFQIFMKSTEELFKLHYVQICFLIGLKVLFLYVFKVGKMLAVHFWRCMALRRSVLNFNV